MKEELHNYHALLPLEKYGEVGKDGKFRQI